MILVEYQDEAGAYSGANSFPSNAVVAELNKSDLKGGILKIDLGHL